MLSQSRNVIIKVPFGTQTGWDGTGRNGKGRDGTEQDGMGRHGTDDVNIKKDKEKFCHKML